MKPDVIATVIEVASLTEDRAPEEQRAMLELALWVDNERARFTSKMPTLPYLTMLVDATYHPEEDQQGNLWSPDLDNQRRAVELTTAQRDQLAKLDAKFVPCEKCGVRKGDHAVACLTSDLESHAAHVE